MRQPVLDRDYMLIQVYKCWHCDQTHGSKLNMVLHIRTEHPETLSD